MKKSRLREAKRPVQGHAAPKGQPCLQSPNLLGAKELIFPHARRPYRTHCPRALRPQKGQQERWASLGAVWGVVFTFLRSLRFSPDVVLRAAALPACSRGAVLTAAVCLLLEGMWPRVSCGKVFTLMSAPCGAYVPASDRSWLGCTAVGTEAPTLTFVLTRAPGKDFGTF